jgi:hypothetical protein
MASISSPGYAVRKSYAKSGKSLDDEELERMRRLRTKRTSMTPSSFSNSAILRRMSRSDNYGYGG